MREFSKGFFEKSGILAIVLIWAWPATQMAYLFHIRMGLPRWVCFAGILLAPAVWEAVEWAYLWAAVRVRGKK